FSVWIFSAKGSIPAFLLLVGTTAALCVTGLIKRKTLNPNIHFLFFIVISILGYFVISGSNPIVSQQFQKFSSSLWGEYGTSIVLISVPGVFYLSKFNLKLYYFTILAFFGCLFYSINYDINDIYSYFLLSYITIAIWAGYGVLFIYDVSAEILKDNVRRAVFCLGIISLSLIALNTNYAVNDESKNTYVEEFTMNIFKNAVPKSIIISSQWDFWVSASWYYHFVKNIRTDIIVIDKELLRRSWYYKFLERNYPDIYNNSKSEIEKFTAELYKFEHNLPFDTKNISKLFEEMLASFVKNNPGRRTYVTWEIDQVKEEPVAKDYIRIPDGLLLRLAPKDSVNNNRVSDYIAFDFSFTPAKKNDYYHETLMLNYAMMLTASANYLLNSGRTEDAKKYLKLALLAKPSFQQAMELMLK